MAYNPTFSFIIPVYNTSVYLSKCIDSIINQSFADIEILLINDGSTDDSGSICDVYAKKDTRIKVIHKTNEGLSAARNDGIKVATGDYIILVDSDDFIEQETCEVFKRIIDTYPDVDIIASNHNVIRPSLSIAKRFYAIENNTPMTGSQFLKLQMQKRTMHIQAQFSIYRRDFINANNLSFKQGILHEDELWIPTCYLTAKSVVNSNLEHYNYLIREGSITNSKNNAKRAQSYITIINELEKHYDLIPDKELRAMLMNTLVNLFFIALKLLLKSNEWETHKHLFHKRFLLNKANRLSNKWRVFLFFILGEKMYLNKHSVVQISNRQSPVVPIAPSPDKDIK